LHVTLNYNISAIVIISESFIDAAGLYNDSKVISITNIENGALLR